MAFLRSSLLICWLIPHVGQLISSPACRPAVIATKDSLLMTNEEIALREAIMRLFFGSICFCVGLTHCSLVTVPLGTAGSLAGAGLKAGGSMASSTVRATGGFTHSGMQAMNRPIQQQPPYALQYPQQQFRQPHHQAAYPKQSYPQQLYPQQPSSQPYPQPQPQGQWYQGRWYPYAAQQR